MSPGDIEAVMEILENNLKEHTIQAGTRTTVLQSFGLS